MKEVLVTGGAGYIGSHTVSELLKNNYRPVVVDDLSNGFREALPTDIPFYQVDVRNSEELRLIFEKHNISAVIHLAARAIVAESFDEADEYFSHNYYGTLAVLDCCREFKVKNLIFASSSTIYGDANGQEKLNETHQLRPISPYGKSKQMCEEKITAEENLNYFILRHFNVAGACSLATNGQRGKGSARILFHAARAVVKNETLAISGVDYETPDGTCVRDYIHVEDVADIHVRSLNALEVGPIRKILNCGYGHGYSVRQIAEAFQKYNQVSLKIAHGPRRPGDPAYLVGDNSELVQLFNWQSRFSQPLEAICRSTYNWEKKRSL